MEEKKKSAGSKTAKKEVKKVEKKVVKKTTTKASPKKETVKKVVEEKSALPVEESFGVKFKRFISSYKFLYTAFAVLFVLVLLLAVMVFVKGREATENNSNIVFSIMEKNTRNYLNMDLESLVGKEYTLKVANYRKDKINEDGASYSITITNGTKVELEVVADDSDKNLITDQKETVLEGKFGTTEKEEVVYTFRVKNADKIKKGDTIRIEVAS